MRTATNIAFCKIRSWRSDYKIWAAFLLCLALCIINISKYIAFAKGLGSPVQAVEAYIIMGSSFYSLTGFILGALLLLSDVPFKSKRSPYEILRVGKKKWILGQISYVIIACLLYSLATLLFSFAICALSTDVFISNDWSSTMKMLAIKQPVFAVTEFKIAFQFAAFITSTTPYTALLMTYFFNTAYICLLGMCILTVNVFARFNVGWIAAASVHIAGYVIIANGPMMFPQYLSLLCCAIPATHFEILSGITPFYALSVFLVFIFALVFVSYKCAKRIMI